MKFRWLLPALLFLSFLLLYLGNKQTDNEAIIRKLELSVRNQLDEDSLTIRRFIQSNGDRTILNSLNHSVFFIEVFKNDSIIYWNNRRICSSNNGLPPMVKRQRYYASLTWAAQVVIKYASTKCQALLTRSNSIRLPQPLFQTESFFS